MQDYESYLKRWQDAGVLDAEAAARIRVWEGAEERPAGLRWQVLLALICGGLLLAAGVVLFVAAHWEQVSPLWRFLLVMGMLSVFHAAAIVVRERFDRLATVLHAIGTVTAGAAIALVGQIFNMQEHWPAAVMLWALCAGAAWWLLGDQIQQVFTLLLTPAWVVSEWVFRYQNFQGVEVYAWRMVAVWAALYLTVYLSGRRRLVMGILFAAAALGLVIALPVLAYGWESNDQALSFVPMAGRCVAWVLILVVPAGLAWVVDRKAALPAVLVVALASVVMPFLTQTISEGNGGGAHWDEVGPGILSYALGAAVAVFLAWWGVRLASKLLINYGMVGFGLAVLWFYFSDLMDKMDRSLGLIGLGLLFFLGGWLLEKMRRRLVGGVGQKEAAE